MICPTCATENRPEARFCQGCGTALARVCPNGHPLAAGARFCDECGAAVDAAAPAVATAPAEPVAERRLVSVLFVDLVGFTTASEGRDAEDTRELLSRYFDTSRTIIERYGGTVEKFIGDAVMAVWGTPTATEDDAERAVRAALDLVTAVVALGAEAGAPLQARAGVLTGEAAVTLGATDQGMVAGDLVNTASRIQSAAEPGTVLVGETTRRATEAAIAYADAGAFELKGKAEPVPLARALRVTSGRQGALKGEGLEAPFVGRDRELQRVKDGFHSSAEEKRAYLVSVTGIGGIGKSRLAWEFYKYFDGLAESVYWHRGRCLSYGDGVTYWALADMVRMRCRITEEEPPDAALSKLRATLDEHLLDADERRFVEPGLAQLLGLGEQRSGDKQELFAAWRLFFERLADVYPTVLVFEDVQWADASLLDFVEYLLEWSRASPLFVLTLARPELLERRPTWGAGHRNFSSLYLEPLPRPAMEELLTGLTPGLPPSLRDQILDRAEGIPLYAVETVRMLLDRGLLVQDGAVYTPVAAIAELEVPETLHALIAARLDGLAPEERRALQDGAVLGKTFTPAALAAVSGVEQETLEPVLASLVRKEVLSLQADPRSPELGQYGFLQDLVRHIAAETLSRRERRARHLAAAAYLETAYVDEGEIAEVLASHYVNAYSAAPDADDAQAVKAKARQTLTRAGERADALGAAGEARRYVEQAAELADEPLERGTLLERAGWHAHYEGDYETAERLLRGAIADLESAGGSLAALSASRKLGQVVWNQGRHEEALALSEQALEVASAGSADTELANLASSLGLGYVFTGNFERAGDLLSLGLDLGESLGVPEAVSRAFAAKGIIASAAGHSEEAFAYTKQGLTIALDHEDWERAYSLYFNLSDLEFQRDRYEAALVYLEADLAIVRRRGSRPSEWSLLAEMSYPLYMLGRWDEALGVAGEVPEEKLRASLTMSILAAPLEIQLHRGNPGEARRILSLFEHLENASDVQDRGGYLSAQAAVLYAEAQLAEALAVGVEAIELTRAAFGMRTQTVKQGLIVAVEAALALGKQDRATELVEMIDAIPRGLRPPYLSAQADRFRARFAGPDDAAAAGYRAAASRFRENGIVLWLAITQLEHGEWLAGRGQPDEAGALLAEAREIFERLATPPWHERVELAEAALDRAGVGS